MARRANTSRQTLEVSLIFEPGHISPACVAQAYEWVMPIRRRPALSTDPRAGTGRAAHASATC